jgi:hypothetical protein
MSADLTTIRTVGGLLPPDVLSRVLAGDKDLDGLTSADYHLAAGESPREAANRSWAYLTGVWSGYRSALAKLPDGDPAVGLTREKWLLVLLRELGYGRVPVTGAGGIVVDDRAFPVSHLWQRTPLHLLGWGVDLDRRTKGVPGAAERAPHAMVQELLNRTDEYLWALVSNGRVLRLLRDSTSLSGQAFVEFDLEAMFDGEVFSDFVLLFLLLHQSRVEVAEGAPATECWLERWRTAAAEQGTRALGLLRDGVKQAIEALGTGFLQANPELNQRIADGELRLDDYHRALLRTVYRLLFLFVVEDRGALLSPDAGPVERQRFQDYFGTARLRRLSLRRRGSRHGDLWESLSVVIDALGREEGRPQLGLPGIGGLFDHGPQDVVMGLRLPNEALLTAVRSLTVVQPKGQPRRTVDYRNLGAEELGSIYESLLELVPRHEQVQRVFTLEDLAGNDRKTSGSYYTPTALIDLVLDEALDPLLDEAEKSDDPEAALLALTVCDPACGSGHFLVAAARRIAARVAIARTGEIDPTPSSLQEALRDVVARCIYGVDINPMAAELAKVSLWLEAATPGKPLSFLDAHIKVGNALLGAAPALLAQGIPDAAYDPIEGDDKKHAAALKRRNYAEREAARGRQGDLFSGLELEQGSHLLTSAVRDLATRANEASSLADMHVAQRRYREFERSEGRLAEKRRADTWCAAFVSPKVVESPPVTHDSLDGQPGPALVAAVSALARRYRFFHWFLEFPEIFTAVADSVPGEPGFSCVVGNPPWERLKIQELEYFSRVDPAIAASADARTRKARIQNLRESNPEVWAEYQAEARRLSSEDGFLRRSGRFGLAGRGRDINTYSVFVETAMQSIGPKGRVGLVVPAGLATDATTSVLLGAIVQHRQLASLFMFENEDRVFAGVHHAFKFAVVCLAGPGGAPITTLAAHLREPIQAKDSNRWYRAGAEEIRALNPTTLTLPVCRSQVDLDILLKVHRSAIPLGAEGDGGFGLATRPGLFHMSNDSSLFVPAEEAGDSSAELDVLYEAKMVDYYDHRHATYAAGGWVSMDKDDPTQVATGRYFVPFSEVRRRARGRESFAVVRDIAGPTNARTVMATHVPARGISGTLTIVETSQVPEYALTAVLSSLVLDYCTRQKMTGNHVAPFVLKQMPFPPIDVLRGPSSLLDGQTPLEFIRRRVLELTYSAWDLAAWAKDLGDDGAPFRWNPARRMAMRSEIDALVAVLFGLQRDELDHVVSSFRIVADREVASLGEFRTRLMVLEAFDRMHRASGKEQPYTPLTDPEPGHGPRYIDVEVGRE